MPLGDVPLGGAPLGAGASAIEPEDKPKLPRALYFDPLTRDNPLDARGRYVDVHPVDAQVELALFLEYGQVSAAPDTGQTLRSVDSPIGPGVALEVNDRVRRALRRLLERRLIRVVRIDHYAPNRHTLFVAVTYENLQTGKQDTRLVPA